MNDKENLAKAVFQQICEVNELDPEAVSSSMNQMTTGAGKLEGKTEGERLIWTALDQRARTLIQQLNPTLTAELKGDGGEYSIDADPAAPAFVINEDTVRSKHESEIAGQLIEALGHVKLPVQG